MPEQGQDRGRERAADELRRMASVIAPQRGVDDGSDAMTRNACAADLLSRADALTAAPAETEAGSYDLGPSRAERERVEPLIRANASTETQAVVATFFWRCDPEVTEEHGALGAADAFEDALNEHDMVVARRADLAINVPGTGTSAADRRRARAAVRDYLAKGGHRWSQEVQAHVDGAVSAALNALRDAPAAAPPAQGAAETAAGDLRAWLADEDALHFLDANETLPDDDPQVVTVMRSLRSAYGRGLEGAPEPEAENARVLLARLRCLVSPAETEAGGAARTELAQVREQRDRALDLAGGLLDAYDDDGIDHKDARRARAELDRLAATPPAQGAAGSVQVELTELAELREDAARLDEIARRLGERDGGGDEACDSVVAHDIADRMRCTGPAPAGPAEGAGETAGGEQPDWSEDGIDGWFAGGLDVELDVTSQHGPPEVKLGNRGVDLPEVRRLRDVLNAVLLRVGGELP